MPGTQATPKQGSLRTCIPDRGERRTNHFLSTKSSAKLVLICIKPLVVAEATGLSASPGLPGARDTPGPRFSRHG